MFSPVARRPAPLLLLLASACGGNVVSLGDDAVLGDGGQTTLDGGTEAATLGSGPRSTSGNAGATPSLPLETCSGAAGTPVTLSDSASAKAAVVGLWLLCTRASPFGTTDEVGIEILDTGAWYKLYDQNGLLVRGDADGELGTFTVGGVTSGQSSFTLDLLVPGSIAIDDVTTVTTAPQRMTVGSASYGFYRDF